MNANLTRDQRLLRWIVNRPIELLTVLYVLVVLWGGLVPFHFGDAQPHRPGFFLGLPLGPAHIPDIAGNVAVYLPVGLLVRMLLRRLRWGAVASLAGATMVGAGLSLLVETLQLYCAHRTSSAIDLGANTAGTLVGAALETLVSLWFDTSAHGLCETLEGWAERIRSRPVVLLAQAWAVVIALAALTPGDVVISVDRAARSLRDAAWIPFSRVTRIGGSMWLPPPKAVAAELWQLRLDYAWTVLAYAGMAVLVSRYLARHCREGGLLRALQAVVVCGMFAAALSIAQLGIMSRASDVTYVLLAVTGALAGVLVADGVMQAWSPATTSGAVFAPVGRTRLVAAGALLVTAYIGARELAPFTFDLASGSIAAQAASAEWLPLRMYQSARLPIAVDDLVHKTMRWAALAMIYCLYRRHRGLADERQPVVRTAAMAACLAAGLEAAQLLLPARNPAITDVLVAAVASGAAVMLYRLAAAGATIVGLVRPVEDERIIYNVEFGAIEAGPREKTGQPPVAPGAGPRRPGGTR